MSKGKKRRGKRRRGKRIVNTFLFPPSGRHPYELGPLVWWVSIVSQHVMLVVVVVANWSKTGSGEDEVTEGEGSGEWSGEDDGEAESGMIFSKEQVAQAAGVMLLMWWTSWLLVLCFGGNMNSFDFRYNLTVSQFTEHSFDVASDEARANIGLAVHAYILNPSLKKKQQDWVNSNWDTWEKTRPAFFNIKFKQKLCNNGLKVGVTERRKSNMQMIIEFVAPGAEEGPAD